jgi:4'-phosphopantetheinyl transferase
LTGVVQIDLWLWPLDCDAAEYGRRRALLTAAETARADRFVQDRDRVRYVSGRWRLREILSDLVGTAAPALPLTAGPNGKPFLPGGPAFNLSHAAGWAVLVVTANPKVWLGVDIEGGRPVYPGLDERAFAPEERAALHAVDAASRDGAFFRGWTRKEAVVKATGEGLRANLAGFAVTLDRDQPRLLRFDGDSPAAWRLHDFDPGHDLSGAIACRTGGREISVTRHT